MTPLRAPELAVVIPTRGSRATLDRVLARLRHEARAAPPHEVVVAADATADETRVRERFVRSGVIGRVVRGAVPGASAARNAGWQATAAPIVVFTDDDVLPRPGFLTAHHAVHAAHPGANAGVIGPVVWAPELRVTPFMRWLERAVQFDFGGIDGGSAQWSHFYTANASVKREALAAVGGFDEANLPFGYEDLDVARRMSLALGGLMLHLARGAVGEHLHAITLDEFRLTVRRIARAERRFVALHPDAEPWFHRRFTAAAAAPPARGRGAPHAGAVPARLPGIGPRVTRAAHAYWSQQLADPFLDEWAAAAAEEAKRAV